MHTSFWIAFSSSLVAALVTCTGIFTIRRFADWGRRNTAYFMCFAAGVLVSASFLHIIPTAFSMNRNAPIYVAVGFFGLHLFNRLITASAYQGNPERAESGIGVAPVLGIGLHSFIDGIVYSVAFSTSVFTGVLATAGMILHEFPEGIITYLLLVRGGFTRRSSLILSLLAAAATTPAGMLLSYPIISRIEGHALGALLAISGGALIYVGATHLLPQAEKERKRFSFAAVGAGILVAIVIVLSEH
jgi:zinc and cadmium transporter